MVDSFITSPPRYDITVSYIWGFQEYSRIHGNQVVMFLLEKLFLSDPFTVHEYGVILLVGFPNLAL